MKSISIFVSILLLSFWAFMSLGHYTTPSPFKFWDNYGFRVGQTVVATYINENPFRPNWKPDTLIVKDIKNGYIQFTNGRVERFGSIGMNFCDWKVIK